MVEFSRHRREQLKASGQVPIYETRPTLSKTVSIHSMFSMFHVCELRLLPGQERRSGGRGGRNGKGKQSAPRAFGTNDHGPGMKPDEVRPTHTHTPNTAQKFCCIRISLAAPACAATDLLVPHTTGLLAATDLHIFLATELNGRAATDLLVPYATDLLAATDLHILLATDLFGHAATELNATELNATDLFGHAATESNASSGSPRRHPRRRGGHGLLPGRRRPDGLLLRSLPPLQIRRTKPHRDILSDTLFPEQMRCCAVLRCAAPCRAVLRWFNSWNLCATTG